MRSDPALREIQPKKEETVGSCMLCQLTAETTRNIMEAAVRPTS